MNTVVVMILVRPTMRGRHNASALALKSRPNIPVEITACYVRSRMAEVNGCG